MAMVVSMLALVVGVRVAKSQGPTTPTPTEHLVVTPGEMQWGEAPPGLPKNIKAAVLAGDPSKSGLFVVRLKIPSGTRIMPHWHPTDENITVISGSFAPGMGDHFDANVKPLNAGGFVRMPAKMHHFAMAKTDAIVEIASMGPFMINYIDPKDDPRKTASAQ
jgi:quercetin dioxygenase-like cupin family protein